MTKKVDEALRSAVERRGWELVEMDAKGYLVPRIVQKSSSFRGTTYRGQRYKSGTWGNGAGYRWARHDLEKWVQKIGELSDGQIVKDCVDWVLSRMPHRAIQVIHGIERDTIRY